jgi:diacylglycerol O-acyltransferase
MSPGDGSMAAVARMSDLEAIMWRLEGLDPMYATTMRMIATLDRPADAAGVEDRLGLVCAAVPRLRDLVAEGPLATVPPRWEPDPSFDVRRHVLRVRCPGRGRPSDLLLAAEAVCTQPLARDRPPWRLVFVDGLDSGRQGLLLELHHSYTDGVGGVRLALELFDAERCPPVRGAPATERAAAARQPVRSEPSVLGRLLEDLAFEGRRSREILGRLGPWLAATASRDPAETAAQALEFVGSVREQAVRVRRPGSAAMTRRSAVTRLAAIDLPLAGLRTAARRAGGTVNDAFVSGLLGGLGRYHAKHGSVPSSLRVGVPVSMRQDFSAEMGNFLQGLLVLGPLRIDDPGERIRLVHEIVLGARAEPVLGLIDDAAALAVGLPGAPRLLARMMRSVDVIASNVAGPAEGLYLAGSLIESLVPIGPRGGAGLNATLLSYSGTAHVGINMDPAATPDTGALLECLGAGFEEVLA